MTEREVESRGVVSYIDVLLRQARAEGRAEALAEVVAKLRAQQTSIIDFTGNDGTGYAKEDGVIQGFDEAIAAVREMGEK